ncbi:UPF0262 family protein [Elioraea tepida]|jgi:uncharacterized protein (UPF0262 family)|uniref:UPF0262 protein KO353_11755 n=1 Tax=Elioraea tepida TaxID=2843330 RepID=A0A975U090_9PROT|nr:UPF0262 family protein [Elioraea tepida]QXM23956.1 UPF0262 family protein [Elioraea tepida]
MPQSTRIGQVVLEGEALTRLNDELEADRAAAVADILHENRFVPAGAPDGPYTLHLGLVEGRLAFDIRRADGTPITAVVLAMGPFRRLIKDYLMMVHAHAEAVSEGREARIQAIDMGRRGVHNEAAELLRKRLEGKIEVDFDTARRLFTLICVLHQRITH